MTLLRIGYCCAIALTGAALLPANGFGQQKSLRDQLVGVWVPTAHETTFQNGAKRQQFGVNPKGMMILDGGGNYTQILVRPDLPKYKSNDRTQGEPEEHAATVRGSVANFGTWTVDEAARTLTYHILGAPSPIKPAPTCKAPSTSPATNGRARYRGPPAAANRPWSGNGRNRSLSARGMERSRHSFYPRLTLVDCRLSAIAAPLKRARGDAPGAPRRGSVVRAA